MMKTLALPLAAALLAGCVSSADLVQLRQAVQQASGSAPASGASTGSGSVASGGTGYLPCPTAQPGSTAGAPGCR